MNRIFTNEKREKENKLKNDSISQLIFKMLSNTLIHISIQDNKDLKY